MQGCWAGILFRPVFLNIIMGIRLLLNESAIWNGNQRMSETNPKSIDYFIQGFGSAFFFADPDPDPGGIRGRG